MGRKVTSSLDVVAIDAASNILAKVGSAIFDLASKAKDLFTGLVHDAMEAEKAERDLGAALAQQGHAVDQILPKLVAFNSAIQAGTGIDGDALAAVQAKLTALGVLPKNLEAATVATIGWSRTTGKDMLGAAVDVTKAIMGKTAALEKMGVHVKDSTEAIAFMSRGMALVTAEAQTLDGRMNILSNAWGDFREELGKAGTQSDAIKDSISALSAFVVQLQAVFASTEGKAAVNAFFAGMARWAGHAIDVMGFLGEAWEKTLTKIDTARSRVAGWMGDDFIDAQHFDAEAEDAAKITKAKVTSIVQKLREDLRDIGAGEKIKLPEFVVPKTSVTGQKGTEDEDEAARKLLEKNEAIRLKLIADSSEKAAKLREDWTKHTNDFDIAIDKEQAKLADEQWKDFGDRLKEANDLVEKEAKDMESTLNSIVGPAVGSLGGALKDMVLGNKTALESMEAAWASFRDAMLAMIEQIIAKFIVMTIIESVLGLVTGGGSVAVQAATGAVTSSFDPGGLIFGSSGAGLRSSGAPSVGTSSSALRGGATVNHYNFQTLTLPSRAEYQRHLRDTLEPAMRARARTR